MLVLACTGWEMSSGQVASSVRPPQLVNCKEVTMILVGGVVAAGLTCSVSLVGGVLVSQASRKSLSYLKGLCDGHRDLQDAARGAAGLDQLVAQDSRGSAVDEAGNKGKPGFGAAAKLVGDGARD